MATRQVKERTVFISLRRFPAALKEKMLAAKQGYMEREHLKDLTNEAFFAVLVDAGLDAVGESKPSKVIPHGVPEWDGRVEDSAVH
jgi:hypothetical protein